MKQLVQKKLKELNQKEIEVEDLYMKGLIPFDVSRIYFIILEGQSNMLESILKEGEENGLGQR